VDSEDAAGSRHEFVGVLFAKVDESADEFFVVTLQREQNILVATKAEGTNFFGDAARHINCRGCYVPQVDSDALRRLFLFECHGDGLQLAA
jgi:hypothetical protein